MMNEIHGGNIWQFSNEMFDFSASLTPLGMPETVKNAAIEGIFLSHHYPDPDCTGLRKAISETQKVPMEWCICGNGAADLLDRLMLALRPKCCMLCPPTFGEYQRSLDMTECKVIYHYTKAEQGFDVTERLLKTLRAGLDLLILCNPNNPTGKTIKPAILLNILQKSAENHTYLLVDESFLDLTDDDAAFPLTSYLGQYPNLILLRSLTKSYAMPGLRLGYLLTSDTSLLESMKHSGQPWSVSVPAQFAGAAALRECSDWCKQGRELIRSQRTFLLNGLRERGCEVLDSQVNFLLFRLPDVTDLRERMISHGILIRSCGSFRGLGQDYYRIAVRTEEENIRFFAAFDEALKERRERLWQDPS